MQLWKDGMSMTPKQFHAWMVNVSDFIPDVPNQRQWSQIKSKLAEVKTPTRKKAVQCDSSEIQGVFKHWQKLTKHPGAILDPKRIKIIKNWLDIGYTADDLKQAITGCSKTDHNIGKNDRQTRYDSLELILRNGGNIDRFMAAGDSGGHVRGVEVRKCNYPGGCAENTQGPKFSRCFLHMAEEFKEIAK